MIPDWASERQEMVETQLRRRGIHDERVLQVMREIPREEFVPAEHRVLAYRDEPVHIGFGQTISQPYMTALMAEVLEGVETVLVPSGGKGGMNPLDLNQALQLFDVKPEALVQP